MWLFSPPPFPVSPTPWHYISVGSSFFLCWAKGTRRYVTNWGYGESKRLGTLGSAELGSVTHGCNSNNIGLFQIRVVYIIFQSGAILMKFGLKFSVQKYFTIYVFCTKCWDGKLWVTNRLIRFNFLEEKSHYLRKTNGKWISRSSESD